MDKAVLKLPQEILLLIFPLFGEDSLQDWSLVQIDFSYLGGTACQHSRNFRVIDSVGKYFELARILCAFLYFTLILRLLCTISLNLLFLIIQSQRCQVDLFTLFQFIGVFLLKLLNFVNRIQFLENRFCNIFGCLTPKCQIFLRIWSKEAIEVKVFDPLAIALTLFSPDFQKLRYFLIPSIDMNSIIFTEVDELANFEHMIFRLETIRYDMRPQRNHLQSFELAANLPADVVNTELESFWRVQEQQYSQFREDLIHTFAKH